MSAGVSVRRLRTVDEATVHALSDVLAAVVASGASVIFYKDVSSA